MLRLKCFPTLAVAIAAVLGPAMSLADGQPLQAVLTIKPQVIRQGNPLSIQLELRNISVAPVSVYRHIGAVMMTPGYVEYRLQKDGQQIVVNQAIDKHAPPRPEDYQRLAPGASTICALTLSRDAKRGAEAIVALVPGSYVMTAEIVLTEEGRSAGVSDAWAGTLTTNAVHFEVEKETSQSTPGSGPR